MTSCAVLQPARLISDLIFRYLLGRAACGYHRIEIEGLDSIEGAFPAPFLAQAADAGAFVRLSRRLQTGGAYVCGQAVFQFLFGSYFGDWNNRDNILRAPLANEDILTSIWLGPQINANFGLTMHHMALGEPIGYAVDANHYRGRIYHESSLTLIGGLARGLQINLMGDPTLRLHVLAPVTNVTRSLPDKDTKGCLSWKPSPEANNSDFRGYYVYAADDRHGPFTVLNSERPVTTTSFELPKEPKRFHMVRAAKLERTPSGTYQNLSQGIIVPERP